MRLLKPFVSLFLCLALGAIVSAQTATSPRDVDKAVRKERTIAIKPEAKPPSWMDYDKIQTAYAFIGKHSQTIFQVLGTSSLSATFAAKDVAPILMQTGKLPKNFNQRMMMTVLTINQIMSPSHSQSDFVAKEYAKAYDLGELHSEVADAVKDSLAWKATERVPMSGQAMAFVLYTFGYWPLEEMIATKEIDPLKDRKDIDAYCHYWSVVGYAMGVPEELLPRDYQSAQTIVAALRKAQYAGRHESLPIGLPALLGGNVRMLVKFADKGMTNAIAAKVLANMISLSPGQAAALGLGTDPTARLLEYANLPTAK